MTILGKFGFVSKVITDITEYIETVGEDYAGNIEIETFENTLYITCEETHKFDLEKIFTDLDFIVRDNGNDRVKFMIHIGWEA